MDLWRANVPEAIELRLESDGGGWSDRFITTSPTGDPLAWHTAVVASALHSTSTTVHSAWRDNSRNIEFRLNFEGFLSPRETSKRAVAHSGSITSMCCFQPMKTVQRRF